MEKKEQEALKRELHALRFITEGGMYVSDIEFTIKQTGDYFNFKTLPEMMVSDGLDNLVMEACRKRCEQIEGELKENTEL